MTKLRNMRVKMQQTDWEWLRDRGELRRNTVSGEKLKKPKTEVQ
jgi:hypothetical protein